MRNSLMFILKDLCLRRRLNLVSTRIPIIASKNHFSKFRSLAKSYKEGIKILKD